jgi:hypothetical protein
VFTARYGLIPYKKQITFSLKEVKTSDTSAQTHSKPTWRAVKLAKGSRAAGSVLYTEPMLIKADAVSHLSREAGNLHNLRKMT